MLFGSKRKLKKENAAEALSVSKEAVKLKLAELNVVSKQADNSFQETAIASREAVEKLTAVKTRKKKPLLQIVRLT